MTIKETTLNLINAIQAGDAVEIESAFNAAMADKVSERLETMRADVAQNMFKTVTAEEQPNADAETSTEE